MSVQVEEGLPQNKLNSITPQTGLKNRLDDLPSSNDTDFWAEADCHRVTPEVMFDNNHYFKRISGHQAYCEHCGWGFQLEPGDKIVDGHLIDKTGKKVL